MFLSLIGKIRLFMNTEQRKIQKSNRSQIRIASLVQFLYFSVSVKHYSTRVYTRCLNKTEMLQRITLSNIKCVGTSTAVGVGGLFNKIEKKCLHLL